MSEIMTTDDRDVVDESGDDRFDDPLRRPNAPPATFGAQLAGCGFLLITALGLLIVWTGTDGTEPTNHVPTPTPGARTSTAAADGAQTPTPTPR